MRIAGINLPKEKRIEVGLTFVYGIGRKLSLKMLRELNINPNTKVQDVNEIDEQKLRDKMTKLQTEGDLRRKIQLDIKHLMDVGTYRGYRHKKGLPVRGQKTKKNARTRKGKKKTVANKKIAIK